jgi:hypothetical protein
VHVLDIIRKKKIYGFYESFIVYILNRQFLIVIQCFFSCIFVRLDFLVHNLDFFNFFVIFVISFCELNTILMVRFFKNSIQQKI